jgi:hypothetical protein
MVCCALRGRRRRVPQRSLTLRRQAAGSLCDLRMGRDELGGKLVQHRVNRDGLSGGICARAQCLRQRVRLEEAARDSRDSGVFGDVGRRIHGDVRRRLTTAAPTSCPAMTGAAGTFDDPIVVPSC